MRSGVGATSDARAGEIAPVQGKECLGIELDATQIFVAIVESGHRDQNARRGLSAIADLISGELLGVEVAATGQEERGAEVLHDISIER